MAIRYRIVHTSEYRFGNTITHCDLKAMLRPRDTGRQRVAHFQIATTPLAGNCSSWLDRWGNHVAEMDVSGELQRMVINADSTVAMSPGAHDENHGSPGADTANFLRPTKLVPMNAEISNYANQHIGNRMDPVAAARKVALQIHESFTYQPGATDVNTSAAQVLRRECGVCQDFAHLSIAMLRSLGLPARYVSGYVHTAAFRGTDHRMAADASHAWFEVFDPLRGWKGFDPTNGRQADEHYIIVAIGRDYDDVVPLKGVIEGGGASRLRVCVDVQRID